MKTYKIHIIRHGITQANLDGQYAGHGDYPLCEQGKNQLEQMVADYEYPESDALFCSPLTRCIETAKIIYPEKKPIIINELIEYNFGEFEGRTADELRSDELFVKWLSGDADAAPPFGESNRHFGTRVCSAFTKLVDGLIKTGTASASLVIHGGVIMALMNCFAVPELPMTSWLVPNGCGYTICITPSLWSRLQKFEVMQELPVIDDEDFHEGAISSAREKLKNANYGFFNVVHREE
ncbi:MAG: histidine phosphatase family protein [Oscillospiraceae bacterium]